MENIDLNIERLQNKIEVQQRVYKIVLISTIVIVAFILLYIGVQLYDIAISDKDATQTEQTF